MLLLLAFVSLSLAGKILVFNPTIGHSHVRLLGNLADLYGEEHNVTIFSPIVDDTVEPFGSSNSKIKKIIYYSKYVDLNIWKTNNLKSPEFWKTPSPDGLSFDWNVWDVFIQSTIKVYQGLLEDKEMLDLLIHEQFDLGILEILEPGAIALFEVLNIKANIIVGSLGMAHHHYTATGIPFLPSFMPDFITTFDGEMSFWERLTFLIRSWQMNYRLSRDIDSLEMTFRKHYPTFPDIRTILKNRTGVIFTNTNEFTESPRIKSNMVQYIGGTNVHPVRPLPDDLKAIVQQRTTVFVSFGTFVQSCTMPLEMKLEFLEAFSSFPNVTFLWKYEVCKNDMTPFKNYPNVITREWFPQADLLGDPDVKGFITHAGMNSLLEVSFRGKPIITIPLFADQFVNAKSAVKMGLAVMIDRTNIRKDLLIEGLKEILDTDSQIVQKTSMASDVLKGKDNEYRQKALEWGRLLIKYGPMEHLRLPTVKMNFFQIYSIDCLGFLASSFLFVIIVFLQSLRLLSRLCLVKIKRE